MPFYVLPPTIAETTKCHFCISNARNRCYSLFPPTTSAPCVLAVFGHLQHPLRAARAFIRRLASCLITILLMREPTGIMSLCPPLTLYTHVHYSSSDFLCPFPVKGGKQCYLAFLCCEALSKSLA